jgi:hypothetical protein
MKSVGYIFLLTFCLNVHSQVRKGIKSMNGLSYPQALVDFGDFKNLVGEVEKHRSERLLSLDEFLKMSKESNTIILDSRSEFRFKRKHLKGSVHLSFTDFTQDNLKKLIPDPNTRILIYCNNNFDGDQIDFASKVVWQPKMKDEKPAPPREAQILSNRKPLMLALNIPTYINLYGYGYRNVYELFELVNINDPRIKFEGTVVK